MEIRRYEEWCDEHMNTDCCVCGDSNCDFVLDFGNYKTTVCEECIDRLAKELLDCKKIKICRHCKYRGPFDSFRMACECLCEKSARFKEPVFYQDDGCKNFEPIEGGN